MNIVVSHCKYERDEHIMVSACSIAVLYILVLLKPGEYSTEVFSFHFADAVLIILAL